MSPDNEYVNTHFSVLYNDIICEKIGNLIILRYKKEVQNMEESCERQRKSMPDNCALCCEMNSGMFMRYNIRNRS